ncbi:hypothetical protein [Vreelandella profundi]|uniref:hypothetical protein n=1 Tax=Vreelandella profundi TaxID=2852117 RepID=UPI001EEFBE70|nr:hypothetical protein [Halomonas profundi]
MARCTGILSIESSGHYICAGVTAEIDMALSLVETVSAPMRDRVIGLGIVGGAGLAISN